MMSKPTRNLAGLMLAVGLLLHGLSPAVAQDTFTAEQKKAIEAVIHDYILENPEIIPEAVQLLQARQERRQKAMQRAAILTLRDQIEYDGVSVVQGNPDGDVTVVEFFDYRCVFCRRMHPEVQQLMAEDTNIRYVFKQFPVRDAPGEKPISYMAAQAAMAAHEQGKFTPFHNALMTYEKPLNETAIMSIARDVGLDEMRLRLDMKANRIAGSIEANMAVANRLGITGTPAYVIGEELIIGAQGINALRAAIQKARDAVGAGD